MELQQRPSATTGKARRLKPEVARKWAARRKEQELKSLYERPVEQLSPEEMARMKAAFFRG